MSRQELEALVEQLRAAPLSFEDDPATIRKNFDALAGDFPVADDVAFDEVDLGGIRAMRSAARTVDDARVLLYLHGGGYVAGSPGIYRSLWSGLGAAMQARAVAPYYRLAPEHPFPAAVDDAVAAYRGLLAEGHRPTDIAVAGDSAGGGLAVALLVAARDAGLELPACAVLFSPWTDLACDSASMRDKAAADPSLTPEGLRLSAARYAAGTDLAHPLASPLRADLSGLPPLLIHVGTAEVLLDDATRLAARAAACDVRTSLEVWPGLVHDFPLFAFALGEGRQALERCAAFVADHVAG